MKIPDFNKKALFDAALIHRSYLNENKKPNLDSNERMEFLGDAVLSLVTSTYLYKNYSKFREGQLTNLRSNLVKTSTLAKVADGIGLGEKIKMSKGEEQSGGRKNQSLLADTYEAVIGALFLDRGLSAAEKFIRETLFLQIPHIMNKGSLKDYKSLLQELVQNKLRASPVYKVEQEAGPDHAKTFTVGVYVKGSQVGLGLGASKQKAQEEAAKIALEYYNTNLIK